MNEFIERNRWLLKFYCVAARIIGWVLLFTTGTVTVSILSGYIRFSQGIGYFHISIIIFTRVVVGVVILGVAQFIKYLLETEYQPGWILQHGDKILYLYAALRIVSVTCLFFREAKIMGNSSCYSAWGFLEASFLPVLAEALIFVGLAEILRRVMPVIKESKTLV